MNYYKFTCKDCPERYPACHDNCEKHKNAKEQHINACAELRETDMIDRVLRNIKHGRR